MYLELEFPQNKYLDSRHLKPLRIDLNRRRTAEKRVTRLVKPWSTI